MKTMKKIVAILAVALMLCSILPLSAFAADTETIKVTGTTGVLDGTASISWDGTNYEVVNYKDNSSTAIRTSDSAHFRIYVGNEFYVRGKDGALMSEVVIKCVSKYLINNSSNTVSDGWTVTANSTTITYTASEPSSELHISIGKQSRITEVIITPAVAGSADCEHDKLLCGDTCGECEEYVKEHEFSNNCVAECENGCGTANPNYADHIYDGEYDVACNVCGYAREVNFPEADSALTIPEADAIGLGMSHDTTTPSKYYVTGTVESIANTTYGNLYIVDEDSNKLYVYGTYSADGETRFDAMTEKPQVGMTVTLYGVIGNYNGATQMKNGWVIEMTSNCEHEWDNDCDTDCNLDCGYTREPQHDYVMDIIESTCTQTGCATYECSVCFDSYDEELPLADHNYVNGVCDVCGAEKPNGYAPITSADQLVSGQYVLVVDTGYAPTYLDSTWVLTGQPTIADGIIADATGYLWTLTVDGNSVIITDANGVSIAPKGGNNNGIQSGEYAWNWSFEDGYFVFAGVDSDTVYLASNTVANSGDNKFRAYKTSTCTGANAANYKYKFTLYAASVSDDEPACAHEYDNACDVDCNLCYEAREVQHSVQHAEAVAATCTAMGNVEYWYCDVCGMAWLNAECTQNTNQKAVKTPMADHVYFDDCSAICEVCGEETREASHNVVHVEAVAPTCAEMGNVEYWYCDVCGMAWLDADCIQNTNLRAVKLPATGEHEYDDQYDADCNVCGDVREVPEKPVETIYGDANGDGEIDGLDEVVLAQYNAGWDVELDLAAADANGDGEVDGLDEVLLAQYNAGWDVELGPVDDENNQFNDGELGEW